MSYQLIKEHPTHFEIKHPAGHVFQVSKHGLNPDVLKKIKGMGVVKMADGGEVPESEDDVAPEEQYGPPEPSTLAASTPQPSDTFQSGAIPTGVSFQPSAVTSQMATPNPESGQRFPANDATGNLQGYLAQTQGMTEKGIAGTAAAEARGAKEQAGILDDQATRMKDLVASYQTHVADLDAETNRISQSLVDSKIDPARLWHNSSTGGKVLASIGMILSGIGSGLSGQPNMALKVIDDAIARDIEAQKADLGKKQNMLSLNLHRYGNLNAALQATTLQMNAMVNGQLAASAARTKNAAVMNQAQMAIADRRMQMMPMMQNLALMRVEAAQLGANGEGGIPTTAEPPILLTNPKYQEKRIVVNGRAYQAPSGKDAEMIKNMQAEYEPVRSMVKELDDLGPSAAVPGSEANLKAAEIVNRLTPMLNKMHGLNRLSEEDVHLMQEQVGDPRKLKNLFSGGIKNSQFFKHLDEDLESNYKARLIGYKGVGQYKSFQPLSK